jgi:hypothetical protein
VRAVDIKPGDRFEHEGQVVYEVLDVGRIGSDVVAVVHYVVDGGRDSRYWDADQDVPLVAS